MKQTAVEWFAKQVLSYKSPTNVNGTDYILIPVDKINFLQEQAKAMEKEQIMDAYGHGQNNGYMYAFHKAITINREQYYTETFKSE